MASTRSAAPSARPSRSRSRSAPPPAHHEFYSTSICTSSAPARCRFHPELQCSICAAPLGKL
eukprot:scaffold23994_cov63-Phaeocystis_antarctica.AAC.2